MLRCFLLFLILAVSAGAQVSIGATKKEVIDKLGWPQSTSGNETREILNYPDYSVLLANGRVEKLQFKPKDTKRPNSYTPVAPKTTPRTKPTVSPPTVTQEKPRPVPVPANLQTAQPATVAMPPAQAPGTTTPQRTPAPSPSPQPQLDLFAPFRIIIFGLVPLLLVIAALKTWRRAQAQKGRGKIGGEFRHTPLEPPILRLDLPKMKARPDPLTEGWSLPLLKEIEWHRFEHLVAAYERALGHDAQLTGFGADGGIDVQVFEPGSRTLKRVIQCKAFNNQPVGVELVRAFYGAMTLEKVAEGAFYTTSRFSEDALAIGQEHRHLELMDGATLVSRIKQMPLHIQLKLFDVATEGDYTTPTCASCGVKMVLRTARQGRNAGNDFWACTRCRNTINIRRA